ncbi:NAD/NADP octopine/nopaline dehydrogenase [Butyriboletus roseoflavus]|nr:NAD/NADP octopine/nopaline dehydrogenase [Butyriboletus roseoflavus]
MICSQGFTIIYKECLKVKRIFKSNTSPTASKLDGLAIVDIKKMKTNFQVSCFLLCNSGADLPADAKPILDRVFHTTLSPCTPLEIALGSTVVTYAVTALLNMGRLKDTVNSLTFLACSFHSMLQARKAADLLPFFYSKGMNNPVCNAQLAFDTECFKIGEACGLQLVDLLTDCNSEHGTSYANLREYSLAPEPHNVQKAAPQDIKYCYYEEELLLMVFIHSLAKILSIDSPVITGTIHFYQAALQTDAFTSDQNLGSLQVGHKDLVRFGAKFPA